jgi:FkbM family methyltransferase
MLIKDIINFIPQKLGFQIIKFPAFDMRRRISLINHFKINKIFDIGANKGQYALEIRKSGYRGEIISFEPTSKAYEILSRRSSNDKKWQVSNRAIGNFDGETNINISKNSLSSSILSILPLHSTSAEDSKYIDLEKIKINKLDTIFDDYYNPNDNIYLKIDTQGFEKNVLEGSLNSIPKIVGLQVELSLAPLYEGESLFKEMVEYIEKLDFTLFSMENGFCDPKTGRLLQIDCIFFKNY